MLHPTALPSSTTLTPALQAAFMAGALDDKDFLPVPWTRLSQGMAYFTEPTLEFMQGVFVSEMTEEALC